MPPPGAVCHGNGCQGTKRGRGHLEGVDLPSLEYWRSGGVPECEEFGREMVAHQPQIEGIGGTRILIFSREDLHLICYKIRRGGVIM